MLNPLPLRKERERVGHTATKGSSSNGEHKERVQEDKAKSQESSLPEDGQGGRQSTVGAERRAGYIERQSPRLHFQDFSSTAEKARWVNYVKRIREVYSALPKAERAAQRSAQRH